MKKQVVFTVFLTLQIYEAIAAIFWQSASYVFILDVPVSISFIRNASLFFRSDSHNLPGMFLLLRRAVFRFNLRLTPF